MHPVVVNMSMTPTDSPSVTMADVVLMTVEEHNVMGGLGSAVAEVLADESCGVRLFRHGIKDEYSLIAPPIHLYAHYKLDAEGVRQVAAGVLDVDS